jgi:hypothetical protein
MSFLPERCATSEMVMRPDVARTLPLPDERPEGDAAAAAVMAAAVPERGVLTGTVHVLSMLAA